MGTDKPVAEDETLTHYHALHPHTFTHLKQFILTQPQETGGETEIQLTLIHQEPSDTALILTFYGIGQLDFTLRIAGPLYLDILSIRDRGWQDLKYRVSDEEEGSLSFYCRNFSAQISRTEDAESAPDEHGMR